MKKSLSYVPNIRKHTLTDDQSRFLTHLKLLGVHGLPWEEFSRTCEILVCNREEIGTLLMTPGKLEINEGRIVHPDFKNTPDH